ncbi:MAG: threonine/serine exporter family protein [Bacteroidales bacterium]|nr:threonine/serine exporter family protein [Bacteroidales bacterium]MDE7071857.1 threonine/serine exporter family protein [Bacteroidales bacterium]
MNQSLKLKELTAFIADYASVLLGSGVHCTRVVRNSRRICEAYDMEVSMMILASSIILTLVDPQTEEICTEVVPIHQLPVSFELNSELSALSWKVHDRHESVADLRREFKALCDKPRMNSWLVTLLVSVANACFCRLFDGDWKGMLVVFFSTFVGFRLLRWLKKKGVDHFLAVILVSFVSSFLASFMLCFSQVDATIAVATSVLFMIPGVPMITGVIDIIENHILIGFARLMRALLIVLCLAVGLSISMVIFQGSLL